jgi:hypothetical protein
MDTAAQEPTSSWFSSAPIPEAVSEPVSEPELSASQKANAMLNIFKNTDSFLKAGLVIGAAQFNKTRWLELFLKPTERKALIIGQPINLARYVSAQINLDTFINKIDPSKTNVPLVTETFNRLTKKYPLYNRETKVTTTTDKIERGGWQQIWIDISKTYSYKSALAGSTMSGVFNPEYVGPGQLENYLKNLYSDPNLIGGKNKNKSKKSKKSGRKSRKNKRKTNKH